MHRALRSGHRRPADPTHACLHEVDRGEVVPGHPGRSLGFVVVAEQIGDRLGGDPEPAHVGLALLDRVRDADGDVVGTNDCAIGWTVETGGGSRSRIAAISDAWLCAANAFFPVAIS